MPTSGRIIAGKYELARPLGQGSMGEVWIAHHLSLGEDVALKVLSRLAPGDVEPPLAASARFHFEAKVAARLSRKTRHIVRVTDHGEEGDLAYLVMELLEGQTLERRILHGNRMMPNEVATLVAQLARALTEAHAEGVIHRDLKPSNVFVTVDEDGGPLFKLLDFGIARTIHTHTAASMFATGRGLIFGTPGYMSPEQVLPGCHLDHHCDLWALATVAYESLTGELPLGGSQPQELVANLRAHRLVPVRERDPSLPKGISSFFARAFAGDVGERYGSAAELARAFTVAVEGGGGVVAAARAARGIGVAARTLSITFPMGLRLRRTAMDRATHARNGSRVLFAASLALLLGAPLTRVASRALNGPGAAPAAGAPVATALEYAASEAVLSPRRASEPPAPSPTDSAAPTAPTPSHAPIATKTTPPPAPERASAQGASAHSDGVRRREATTPEPRPEQAPASPPPIRKPFDKSEIL